MNFASFGTAPTTSVFVDSLGAAYTAGVTTSAAYPAVASIFSPPRDTVVSIYITKINPAGSALVYSTFPNPSFFTSVGYLPSRTTAVDTNGNAYVAGVATEIADPSSPGDFMPNIPTTVGAFQLVPATFPCSPEPSCGHMFLLKMASSLGSPVPTLNPRLVNFSAILQKGTTSAPRTIQISNFGDANLTVTGISISGTNAVDFASADSSTCVTTIAVAGSCSFHVTFTANVATGTSNAVVTVNFGGQTSQTVPLMGQAGFPVFQFGSNPVDFGTGAFPVGAAQTGTTSAILSFTNTGTGPMHFLSQPLLIGANPGDFCHPLGFGGACGPLTLGAGGVPPGQTVQITFRFFPQGLGTRTAQLVLQTDAAGSPETFTFTGNAIPQGNGGFSFGTANAVGTSTITAGQTANYSLVAIPTGFNGIPAFTISCTGAPAGSSCSASPNSFSLPANGSPQNVSVTVTTTPRTTASLKKMRPVAWWSLAAALGIVLVRPRKRRLRGMLLMTGMLALVATLLSCGGGGSTGGGGGSGGTPPGTYSLTVTATGNGATNSAPLTLNVR